MKKSVYEEQVRKALAYYEKAGIVLTDAEKQRIEVADFGLDKVEQVGLQLLTLVAVANPGSRMLTDTSTLSRMQCLV